MLSTLRAFASLYRELGPRWTIFRLAYALRLRTGILRLQMPQYRWNDRPLATWLKKQEHPAGRVAEGISRSSELPPDISWNKQTAIDEANRILNGDLKYFSHQFIKTGFPPNWHRDYVTLSHDSGEGSLLLHSEIFRSPALTSGASVAQNDITRHWSQIPDDSAADIKFIWEPNRFSFVYTLVRAYVASRDEKYPEAFWRMIEDWAENNPPNSGANWKDGQEIALRLMAWTFGYDAFLNSPSTTPERKEKLTLYVAAQADRIYKNIGYAISTRSNHTISEAFGLWLVGLLFPELKDSEKYFSLGRQLLEQEAADQIFPDGSYSMYSLNYHRFILHIYLYAFRLGEVNHSPFSTQLKNSITRSIEYLSHLIDPQTGEMPVYGSNDGALVLPLSNCDFTDYRPLLQLGWYITKSEVLFGRGPWDEDLFWLCGDSALIPNPSIQGRGGLWLPSPSGGRAGDEGETSFSHGGTHLLHNMNSHAVIRCTDFTSRPSHADQLHVDLWIHHHNIAVDAGTYLYSGEGNWRNGLARTFAHNTVIVDNKDQMIMVSRFTWANWSKGKVLKHDKDIWQGEHDGYKPVSHKRTVMSLEGDRWLVIDNLIANELHHYALHWLLNDYLFEHNGNSILLSLDSMKYKMQVGMVNGNGDLSVVRADATSTRGWRSRYYGHKERAISVMLEADQAQATFWSYFGFENDEVEFVDDTLKVNSKNFLLV